MAEGKGRCKQSNNMGELGKGERDQLLHKDEKKNALEYTQYRLEKQEKMYKCPSLRFFVFCFFLVVLIVAIVV